MRVMNVSRHRGDLSRGEGRLNFPHGPTQKHPRKSILNVHRAGSHGVKPYPCRNHDAVDRMRNATVAEHDALWGETRESLRAIAKSRGITGYGKWTKGQLIEALS